MHTATAGNTTAINSQSRVQAYCPSVYQQLKFIKETGDKMMLQKLTTDILNFPVLLLVCRRNTRFSIEKQPFVKENTINMISFNLTFAYGANGYTRCEHKMPMWRQ